jgi:hypothetical protein
VFVDRKIRIKPLETVGVVRDCALIRERRVKPACCRE